GWVFACALSEIESPRGLAGVDQRPRGEVSTDGALGRPAGSFACRGCFDQADPFREAAAKDRVGSQVTRGGKPCERVRAARKFLQDRFSASPSLFQYGDIVKAERRQGIQRSQLRCAIVRS